MRLSKFAAIAAASLLLAMPILYPVAAFAQEVATAVGESGEPTLVQQIVTALLGLVSIVVTAIVGWIAAEVRRRFNIEIEAKHREALQSALTNGILWSLQKAGWTVGEPVPDPVLGMARSYVESSVPDALKKFGIEAGTANGRAMLDRLLLPHLPIAGLPLPTAVKAGN